MIMEGLLLMSKELGEVRGGLCVFCSRGRGTGDEGVSG